MSKITSSCNFNPSNFKLVFKLQSAASWVIKLISLKSTLNLLHLIKLRKPVRNEVVSRFFISFWQVLASECLTRHQRGQRLWSDQVTLGLISDVGHLLDFDQGKVSKDYSDECFVALNKVLVQNHTSVN